MLLRSYAFSHHAYSSFGSGLGHEFARGVVHGLGWGIGYSIARHIPFLLILLIAIVVGFWWMARRR
ncbi:hypothetical protein Alches_05030 [Alicyclobacillus hesperidum subsp. aegles]|nr:hypothetical protein SD51_02000 [Alicyclobacillus tengchongensis]GLG00464.1 hypothetical protein Alches_05030 [Alicyclobacillus hesperidum subsp. aegles]